MNQFYLILAKKAIVLSQIALFLTTPVLVVARMPDDPNLPAQAPFLSQIDAHLAWDHTVGSHDTVVAVIDTGADIKHDDLSKNVWINKKEIPGNNIDDDKNGYVDDVSGWNFVDNNNDVRTSVFDTEGDFEAVRHGTVISGLIGAVGNNGRDGTGLNWEVSIMPLRAIDSSGTGAYSDLVHAVQYAMDNGADVISMSFTGTHNNQILKNVLYQAYQRGIVIVAAAGNHAHDVSGNLNLEPVYPACYDQGDSENWIITVGSVDLNDRESTFSNFGDCVDIMAPGEGIYSIERYDPVQGFTNAFGGEWRGTSFSAPLVAGAAALIKSFRPNLSAKEVFLTLLKTADSIEAVSVSTDSNPGRLNIGSALAALASNLPVLGLQQPTALYALQGNDVSRLELGSGVFLPFASAKNAKVIDVAATPQENVVGLLLQRETFYYVQLLTNTGEFIHEISLPLQHLPATHVKKIRFTANPQEIAVEQYDSKRQVTIFTLFNFEGKKVAAFEVAGSVPVWDTGKVDRDIVFAQASAKNTILITHVDLGVSLRKRFTLPVSGKLEAIRFGALTSDTDEHAVVLVRQGQSINQYAVGVETASYRKEFVGTVDMKNPWQLRLVYSNDKSVYHILTYQNNGAFAVKDYRGNIHDVVEFLDAPAGIVY